ncbi:MAG: hypothetical protein ACRCUI_10930 [Polymorphobacter sp.]
MDDSLRPRFREKRAPRRQPGVLPRFAPGELITADALNAIVDAVNALAERIAALEKRCP